MGSRNAKSRGSSAERELLQMLYEKGVAVARVAGSGSNPLPCPDLIAVNKGRVVCIECKYWNSQYLNIKRAQIDELMEWSERANAVLVFAWKFPRKGWFFLTPDAFSQTQKAYNISLPLAMEKGVSLDAVLGL